MVDQQTSVKPMEVLKDLPAVVSSNYCWGEPSLASQKAKSCLSVLYIMAGFYFMLHVQLSIRLVVEPSSW